MLEQQIDILTLEDGLSFPNDPFRPSSLKINGKSYYKPLSKAELLETYQKFEQLVDFKIEGYQFDPEERGDAQERAFRKRLFERIMALRELEFNGQARFLLTSLEDLAEVEVQFSSIPNKLARYAEYLVMLGDAINVLDKLKDKIEAEHKLEEEQHELDLVLNSKTYLNAWMNEQAQVSYQIPKGEKVENIALTQSKMSVTQEAFSKGWMLLHPEIAKLRIERKREYLNEIRYLSYCLDTLKVFYDGISRAAQSNANLMKTLSRQA